jgi:hypothetical protein
MSIKCEALSPPVEAPEPGAAFLRGSRRVRFLNFPSGQIAEVLSNRLLIVGSGVFGIRNFAVDANGYRAYP